MFASSNPAECPNSWGMVRVFEPFSKPFTALGPTLICNPFISLLANMELLSNLF